MTLTLDDIFNNDEFGLLEVKQQISNTKTDEDRLLDTFDDINTFYEKNNREPSPTSMTEYSLLSKLKAIRENEKHKIILKPFDRFNLLGHVEIPVPTIDDVLADDEFGLLETDADLSIFEHRHIPKEDERAKTDFVAQREPIPEKEFKKYEEMFQQVHKELKEGKRKLVPFSNAETNLIEGNFYVIDGVICYFESSEAERVIKESKSGKKEKRVDGRTVTIFENGTKSNMFFRSLGKALLKNGKIITNSAEHVEDELYKNVGIVSEEDLKSGWIYILSSKSDIPQVKNLENLYKIGFSTTKVEDRIKNASQEATYLFGDVSVVAKYKCFNLDMHQFENLIHRFFAEVCLNVDVFSPQGVRITPREWFVVPLNIIDEAIKMLINGSIINYRFDNKSREIVLKGN